MATGTSAVEEHEVAGQATETVTARSGRQRPKVSAIVTTFNEEHNIAECLESLLWCDEIMVVDSYSTDRTAEIVRGYPDVTFYEHTYHGSAAQKNWAMNRAQCEWILIFDADERCPEALRDEIEDLLASGPRESAYRIRRRLFFLGKAIRFSGWQRDQVVRLVRRGEAWYPNRRVHADMVTTGTPPLLRRHMDHYTVHQPGEYLHRLTKYGVWGAAQAWRDGKRSGVTHFVGRPIWRFLRTYFLQLGILDGLHGLLFCMIQAYGTFAKWSILWSWQLLARAGRKPALPTFDDSAETWQPVDDLHKT